jgi:hypothetical protein
MVLSKMCTVSGPKCKRAPTLTAWKPTPGRKLRLMTMSNMPIELIVRIKRLAAAIGTFCSFEFVNALSVTQQTGIIFVGLVAKGAINAWSHLFRRRVNVRWRS